MQRITNPGDYLDSNKNRAATDRQPMQHDLVIATLRIICDCDIREQSRRRCSCYLSRRRALDEFPEVRAAACSVSAILQLMRETVLVSSCNTGVKAGNKTMQGCTLRFAYEGRDSGAIRARALEGRTGELPADHGLASSAWTIGVGRSRGRLAQSLDASRQSVILLRKHFS